MYWLIPLILIPCLLITGCGQVVQTADPNAPEAIATFVAATLAAGTEATTSEVPVLTSTPEKQIGTSTTTPSVTPSLTASITPSLTPSSTPTETQTPTHSATVGNTPTPAAGDPAKSLGTPDWQASFKDSSYWYTFESEQSSIQVKNSALVLTSFKANDYESWSMSYPVISDFYLELQATSGDTCRGKDRYGLIFRAPDPNQGYLFGISCDGSFRVRAWDGETFTEIEDWQKSEHISTGPNQTNRIGVIAEGGELTFYINGHQVEEVEDDTYSRGVFGAYIAASQTPGFSVSVSRAAYWDIP